MKKEYMPRLFDQILEFTLKSKGAVLIEGPKWCGKSRTAERYAKTKINLLPRATRGEYVSLAKNATERFLNYGPKPILYDEWQIVSFIWDDLKSEIDSNDEFGQYILTGSVTDISKANNDEPENETHTGTGRIVRKRMRTMSLFESRDSLGTVSLSGLKRHDFQPSISKAKIDDYAFFICRGGWPLSIGEEKDVALQQAIDFYEAVVTEDIFSLKSVPIRPDEQKARLLMRSLSRHVGGQYVEQVFLRDVIESCSFDAETLSKYLLALNKLFVVENMQAWNTNLRSKSAIRSKPTLYFVDPSIAAACLGITPDGLFRDMSTFGFLFESLAIRDLRIYAESTGAKIYHYRDSRDREADAVVVWRDGEWALIEIKLCDKDDIDLAAKKLVALSKDIMQEKENPSFLMVVTKGETAYQRDDGVYVVPLALLRD